MTKRFIAYDNGGKTADRYNVVPLDNGNPREAGHCDSGPLHEMLGMSNNPTHPQGVSMYGSGMIGSHLGKRVRFESLPAHIQTHAIGRCFGGGL